MQRRKNYADDVGNAREWANYDQVFTIRIRLEANCRIYFFSSTTSAYEAISTDVDRFGHTDTST